MAALYPGTSVSGYNSNPPPDDGTTGANNQITWSGVKSKLTDPFNVWAAAIDSNVTAAFGKTIAGGSVVSTAVDYPATSADQGRNIVVTVSGKIVTTPDATVVHSPFVFCVNNQSSGNITIAGFGGTQNVDGALTAKLGKGRGVILWTDGANWFSSGFVMGNLPLANPPFGFDAPINLQLNATTGSSALTVAVKANDGTDPTTSNPVLIAFHNATGATSNTSPGTSGAPSWVAVTAALSIVVPSTQTLGTANNVGFRFWIVAINNAGTVELALINCVVGGATPTQVFPLPEHNLISTTAIGASPNAGVFYSTTLRTSLAFRILGYVEFAAGMATAGTYTGNPTNIQLFGPGVKKPGDILQTVFTINCGGTSNATTTPLATPLTATITPTSTVNLVRIDANASMTNNTAACSAVMTIRRTNAAGTIVGNQRAIVPPNQGTNSDITANVCWVLLDAPQTVSAQIYVGCIAEAGGGGAILNTGDIALQEIMG